MFFQLTSFLTSLGAAFLYLLICNLYIFIAYQFITQLIVIKKL
jgi:hypothetical protein